MKSAPPIALTLSPWTARKDATTLTAGRDDTETAIRTAHGAHLPSTNTSSSTSTVPGDGTSDRDFSRSVVTQPDWPAPDPPAGVAFAASAGPVHLPSLNDDERHDLMAQLRPWVEQLVTRFHIDARVIPPCWARHTGMVEALTALRDLERDCYSHQAPPASGVDWFRGFREIESRLIELAALTSCTAREHRDPPPGWPTLQHEPAPATPSNRQVPRR